MENNDSVSAMEYDGSVSANTISWKDIETAQIQILREAFRLRYKDDSKFVNEYAEYITSLRQAEDPDEHAKAIAIMLFPDEDAYNKRMGRYRKWYANKKNLLTSIEHLYSLYYKLSKEDSPMNNDEIEDAIENKLKSMQT